jgi:hypothetical protein
MKVQNINVDGGISSFQICNGQVLIRGTFNKEDLLEIIEILDGKKEKHSKLVSESEWC